MQIKPAVFNVIIVYRLNQLTDTVVDLILWYRKLPTPINDKVREDNSLVFVICAYFYSLEFSFFLSLFLFKWSDAFDACVLKARAVCERLLVADLQGDCRCARILLGLLSMVDGVEFAVSRVMAEVIDPKIQYVSSDLSALLEHILESVSQVSAFEQILCRRFL